MTALWIWEEDWNNSGYQVRLYEYWLAFGYLPDEPFSIPNFDFCWRRLRNEE
jgi:hypothetical protein